MSRSVDGKDHPAVSVSAQLLLPVYPGTLLPLFPLALMPIPFHVIVEGNPAIIYASRNGSPNQVLPTLERFLQKFWQERDLSGETSHTAECLLAQIIVRFGYEICEDDFSNLRVSVQFDPQAEYLYQVSSDRTVSVWIANENYRQNPALGVAACQNWCARSETAEIEAAGSKVN
jgi:hypothetical protein